MKLGMAKSWPLWLLLVGNAAWAADGPALQHQYEQVQQLNNEAGELVHLAHPEQATPADLVQAKVLLHQALGELDQMQSQVDAASRLNGQMQDRRVDVLLKLAVADALQGNHPQALDALDALRNGSLHASYVQLFQKFPALQRLHDEPRYRALITDLQALDARWKATAIATPASADLDEAHRIAGLSLFWSEARYNFAYFDHVPGLDWNQAYLDFLPKVIAAVSLHDYYDVMMRFAPLLRDSHTNIYPPASLQDEFFARPPLASALIDGHVVVTWIGSPALSEAGMHVGDEIVTVDGQPVRAYAKQHVAPYVSSSTPQDRAVREYDYQLLMGDHRKPVVLGLRNAAGELRTVTLSREKDPPATSRPRTEWRMLDGGIAYLAINEFEDDAGAKAFARHLPQILKAHGLILDVRRNGGGSTHYGLDILSYLSEQPVPEGAARSLDYVPAFRAWGGPYTQWRHLAGETYDKPRQAHYAGSVAVLVGPQTFSAAEDFALSFELMKRGKLMGAATGGSTGQPLAFNLPGGGSARVCTLRYGYPDGREFVGKGIMPDVAVAETVADIRAGRDPVLQRAVTILAGQRQAPARSAVHP
ncbi:MAG: S41 family peptidase [Rhodanobacter sp.]